MAARTRLGGAEIVGTLANRLAPVACPSPRPPSHITGPDTIEIRLAFGSVGFSFSSRDRELAMEYRRFGQTELPLSVFSLGLMRCLGSESVTRQTIERALDRGINHLETAQGYGPSERYLGATLAQLAVADRPYLTTKIPPLPADQMWQAIGQSLDRLGLDSIDCLAIHGINTEEHLAQLEAPDGCLVAVSRAVAQGLIRHVGFSTHGSLPLILRTIATEHFSFINLHYYLFFQRNAPALSTAADRDMGVFIISPADKGGQLFTPPDTLIKQCAPLSPLAVNYRFLLSNPQITTLSLGARTAADLDWPLTTIDGFSPKASGMVLDPQGDHCPDLCLDPASNPAPDPTTSAPTTPPSASPADQLAQITLTLSNAQAAIPDLCHQCHACLPCPEAINIPEILRLRTLDQAHGMTSFGQYRYRMFENAGHWFPGRKGSRCTDCGDCLPRCPHGLPIPTLLRDTDERLNGPSRRRLWQ